MSTFIIGDRKEGYDVVKLDRKKFSWESRVWNNGRIARHDRFETKREAINYCHSRYREHHAKGLKIHIRRRK